MILIQNLNKRFNINSYELSLGRRKKRADKDQAQAIDKRQRGRYFYSIENINFAIAPGEIFGLIGPNGAGKTTLLRILSGTLGASSGEILIGQQRQSMSKSELRRQLGFVSGSTSLYERLSVEENLIYFGRLYDMSTVEITERIRHLTKQLNLQMILHRRVLDLSTGMRQRASIARAVMHDPKILILDEPTTGLDIIAMQNMMDFIVQEKASGRTVIFSTHHLEEVSLLCDRIGVVMQGQSIYEGTLAGYAGDKDPTSLRRAFMRDYGLYYGE